jgi:hypothetical protein
MSYSAAEITAVPISKHCVSCNNGIKLQEFNKPIVNGSVGLGINL